MSFRTIRQKTGVTNFTGDPEKYCPEDCPADYYLDHTSNTSHHASNAQRVPIAWKTDINGIVAKTGYWRVPDNPTVFVKCLNHARVWEHEILILQMVNETMAQQHCPKAIPRKAIVTDQDYVQTA